jgi:DNA-binding transcriptional LysR family regulator
MLNRIDLGRVDLNLLVLFEIIFEEQHVGKAAERLHLSPSAISHGLKRLRHLLNDPLFLKHPKGVVPTARAAALAGQVAAMLAQARQVVASADPFEPTRSARKFVIGAPDGIAAVALPRALAAVRREAPNVDLAICDLQPNETLAALDARRVDVALHPLDDMPARCITRALYEEDFVIAARRNHPLAKNPSLASYGRAEHLLVSRHGDPRGFVDDVLEAHGVRRRVALTVPSFVWALTIVADSDIVAALPRGLVAAYGARFGVEAFEPPVPLGRFRILAVTPQVAMLDAGVAWLMSLLERNSPPEARNARPRKRTRKRG